MTDRMRSPVPSPISAVRRRPRTLAVALLAAVGLVVSAAAVAQDAPAVPAAPTADATVNLIRLMVKKGLLTDAEASDLLAQARAEANQVRQAQSAVAALPAPTAAVPAVPPPVPGEQRIQYVPQMVQEQIADRARQAVLDEVKREGWARPASLPDWIDSVTFEGDIRLREQAQLYGDSDSFYPDGGRPVLIDYNALNAGGPYDTNGLTNPPLLNLRQDRTFTRLRARFGLRVALNEDWEAGIRLATGSDNSPVSTNQTLGGGLSKKDIWLDRAYVSWRPASWLLLTGGRFRNPFVSTQLLFDDDLNFDGAAAQFDVPFESANALRLFGTLGAFPLESTSDSFPSTQGDKAGNHNKWLFSGQVGVDWSFDADNRLRAALAWHSFYNVQGRLSEPCVLYDGYNKDCSSDWSRPAFMQKGNTLMTLRQIVLNPEAGTVTPQPQYVGLASKFSLADLNLRYDTKLGYTPLTLEANYVKNLSYDPAYILERSNLNGAALVNNVIDDDLNDPDSPRRMDSGDTAWAVQATFGKAEPAEAGDWNALIGYRYIEPDAMPDAYNDSDFHLGGTNAKGYYLGAAWGLARNVWLQGRWLSAKDVSGVPFAVDLLQLDVNARF